MFTIKELKRTIRAYLKLMAAFLTLNLIRRDILKEDIWIISEKKTEARDNGYHFFKYIRTTHPGVKAYFVIEKAATDRSKIEGFGNLIDYDSFTHCMYYLGAKFRVGSQVHGGRPFLKVRGIKKLNLLKRKDQIQVHLKHGIAKDDLPNSYDFRKAGFDLLTCGAKPEYDYYKKKYNYPSDKIKLTGLCRFDNLQTSDIKKEKVLLIMPTFREWLRSVDSSIIANDSEVEKFVESQFFEAYKSLLNNQNLIEILDKYDYKLIFYPHYTLHPYINTFKDSVFEYNKGKVIVADRDNYDVQQLLLSSSILITDFSSVFFDFAYMKKPVVFYQFDEVEYRTKHYKEGYFEYRRDGFGPVFTNEFELINYIIKLLDNNAEVDAEFLNVIDNFFVPYDAENCKRVYESILELQK